MVRQCELASVNRSTVYAQSQALEVDDEELMLCQLIDEQYTRRPFYGSRRMVVYLGEQGYSAWRANGAGSAAAKVPYQSSLPPTLSWFFPYSRIERTSDTKIPIAAPPTAPLMPPDKAPRIPKRIISVIAPPCFSNPANVSYCNQHENDITPCNLYRKELPNQLRRSSMPRLSVVGVSGLQGGEDANRCYQPSFASGVAAGTTSRPQQAQTLARFLI